MGLGGTTIEAFQQPLKKCPSVLLTSFSSLHDSL